MSEEKTYDLLMTDEEVYTLLKIGRSTFARLLREGPPKTSEPSEGDIRTIKRVQVGGARRWVRSSVLEFAGGATPQQEKE